MDVVDPDDDWDVQRLVRHVINVQNRFAAGVTGRPSQATTVDGPALVDDWAAASASSTQAFAAITDWSVPAPIPTGRSTLEDLGWLVTMDLTVHAWDLARRPSGPTTSCPTTCLLPSWTGPSRPRTAGSVRKPSPRRSRSPAAPTT